MASGTTCRSSRVWLSSARKPLPTRLQCVVLPELRAFTRVEPSRRRRRRRCRHLRRRLGRPGRAARRRSMAWSTGERWWASGATRGSRRCVASRETCLHLTYRFRIHPSTLCPPLCPTLTHPLNNAALQTASECCDKCRQHTMLVREGKPAPASLGPTRISLPGPQSVPGAAASQH